MWRLFPNIILASLARTLSLFLRGSKSFVTELLEKYETEDEQECHSHH